MGADLIVCYVKFKGDKTNKQRQKAIINSIDEAKKSILILIYGNGIYEDEDVTLTSLEELKAKHKKIVNDFFECLEFRDVTTIQPDKDIIYLTGGMSWGDSPTDSYNRFEQLLNIPDCILSKGGIE